MIETIDEEATPTAKTASKKQQGDAILEFVKQNAERIPGTQIIVKKLTDHWFRVKFYRRVPIPDSFLSDDVIAHETVYEVIEGPTGYDLVDRTIRDNGKPPAKERF